MLMYDVPDEHDRTYLACYHGADATEMDIYNSGNATVRTDIIDKMSELPRVS